MRSSWSSASSKNTSRMGLHLRLYLASTRHQRRGLCRGLGIDAKVVPGQHPLQKPLAAAFVSMGSGLEKLGCTWSAPA